MPRRTILLAVAWLAGAWLIPVATHLAHADFLLLTLVLLVTASLLRGGRTLLDQVVLATVILLGASALGGLLFAVWPFGLHPVALAGTALTVLGIVSFALKRRPQLRKPALTDFIVAGAGGIAFAYFVKPLLALDIRPFIKADQVSMFAMVRGGGEDNSRHVAIFDTVRRMGGYLMFQNPADMPDLWDALRFYPHGWHLTAGMIDGFLRSSTTLGTSVSAFAHFALFSVIGYGLFCLVLFWAVNWVAGPVMGPWRLLPALVVAAVPVMLGAFAGTVVLGHVAEVYGLTLLAVIVALVSRPLRSVPEQLLVLTMALIGIGFAYYFLLPPAGLAVLFWLWRHRRQVLLHKVAFAVTGGITAVFAPMPAVAGVLSGEQDGQLLADGLLAVSDRGYLVAVAGVVLIGLIAPAGRKLRIWRDYRYPVLAIALFTAAVGVFQLLNAGRTSYYFEKSVHALAVTVLVGLGAFFLVLPKPTRGVKTAVPAVALTLALAVGFGLVGLSPYRASNIGDINRDWGNFWYLRGPEITGDTRTDVLYLIKADQRFPAVPGTATILLANDGTPTHAATMFFSSVQRNSAGTAKILYGPEGMILAGDSAPALTAMFKRANMPVHVIAFTQQAVDKVNGIKTRNPELDLRVDLLPYP